MVAMLLPIAVSVPSSCAAPRGLCTSFAALAHALLEVGGEAASDDGAAAVHAVDDVGGDSGVRLPEDVGRALVPPSSPGPAGGPVLGAGVVAGDARGPEAELLLLGVDAAVEA